MESIHMPAVLFVILGLLILVGPVDHAHCLTAQEILSLKKAGVSDETIQLIIQQENEAKARWEADIQEVEDEKGNRSTLYTTGGGEARERRLTEREKEERAWDMLGNTIIDDRKTDSPGKK